MEIEKLKPIDEILSIGMTKSKTTKNKISQNMMLSILLHSNPAGWWL